MGVRTMMHRRDILALAMTAAVLPVALPPAPAVAQARDVRAEQTDRAVNAFMAAFRVPGAQVAVVKDGRIVFSRAYGAANVAFGVPAAKDSVFTLASITKAFTGLAAMQAVQAGELDLSAPVSRYLDGLPEAWRPVTIRQLLSHMSGLPDINRAPTTETDAAQSWAWTIAQPVHSAPGERFHYCQTNYVLIQRVLNKLHGQAQDSTTADAQIAAAGMVRTRYGDSRDLIPGKGPDYQFVYPDPGAPGVLQQRHVVSLPTHRASRGMVSTAEDMARWIIAIEQGKLLDSKLVETMWAPVAFNDGKPGQWGMGWTILPRGAGRRAVGMTGGARSAFFIYPEHDVAVVILTNLAGSYPEDAIDQIAAIYAPDYRLIGVPALRAGLEAKGFADADAVLAEVKRQDPSFAPGEADLNDWGYRLLASRRTREALVVMKLIAGMFPQSGNAFDSLGEAYAATGDKAQAITAYRRAIELDPKNDNARNRLGRLEAAAAGSGGAG